MTLKRFNLNNDVRAGYLEYPVVYKGYTRPAINFLYRIRAIYKIRTIIDRYPEAIFYGKEQVGYW